MPHEGTKLVDLFEVVFGDIAVGVLDGGKNKLMPLNIEQLVFVVRRSTTAQVSLHLCECCESIVYSGSPKDVFRKVIFAVLHAKTDVSVAHIFGVFFLHF